MTRIFDTDKSRILDRVQVNIPFTWLMDAQAGWMDVFIESRINPEIGLDAQALDQYRQSDFAAVARRFHLAGRTVTIHGPFLDLSPGSPDTEIRAITRHRLSQMIKAADVFCPQTIVCHAGYDETRYGFVRQAWYERAAEVWKWAGSVLAEKGIRLMLENVYETDPEEIGRVLEQVADENTGCCLDVGHLYVFSRMPLSAWLEKLSPYIGQIHLHDNQGQKDDHMGMGEGKIDFAPLFDWLRSLSQIPVITLEPHNQDALVTSISFLEKQGFPQAS
ncbi:MAG: sugar phosphate isomerase/epimerase family protein [Desulfobacterales bacterium]